MLRVDALSSATQNDRGAPSMARPEFPLGPGIERLSACSPMGQTRSGTDPDPPFRGMRVGVRRPTGWTPPKHCQRPPRGPLICRPDVKTLATRAPRPESPVRTSPSSCVRRKFPSRSRPRRGLSKGSARFPACPEQHERRHPDATQARQRRAHRDPVPRRCQDRQHHKQQHEAQTESLEDYQIPHAPILR